MSNGVAFNFSEEVKATLRVTGIKYSDAVVSEVTELLVKKLPLLKEMFNQPVFYRLYFLDSKTVKLQLKAGSNGIYKLEEVLVELEKDVFDMVGVNKQYLFRKLFDKGHYPTIRVLTRFENCTEHIPDEEVYLFSLNLKDTFTNGIPEKLNQLV